MTTPLERRYTRLLGVYPPAHRVEYGREMLAVLLAGARDGQRWPGSRESTSLLFGAARAWAGGFVREIDDARWRDAWVVVGMLAPMLLLAAHLRYAVDLADLATHTSIAGLAPSAYDDVGAVGWAAVLLAVLCGGRIVAAGLAWLTLGAGVLLLISSPDAPPFLIYNSFAVLLGAMAAVALSIPAARRHAVRVIGVPATIVFGVAAAAIAALPALDGRGEQILRFRGRVYRVQDGGASSFGEEQLGAPAAVLLGVVALALLVVLVRIDGPVRRRLVALVLPVVMLEGLTRPAFEGFGMLAAHSFGDRPPASTVEVLKIVLTPAVVFVAGVLVIQRVERRQRLARLGETHERRHPA